MRHPDLPPPARTEPHWNGTSWVDYPTGELGPEPCCGLLAQVATETYLGWALVSTADLISFCPFCGAILVAGPPRDEAALPVPTHELIARGRAAWRELAEYHRQVGVLLGALEERARRRRAPPGGR